MSCDRDGEVDAAGAVQKQGPGALPFPRPEGKDVLWVGTVRATCGVMGCSRFHVS